MINLVSDILNKKELVKYKINKKRKIHYGSIQMVNNCCIVVYIYQNAL